MNQAKETEFDSIFWDHKDMVYALGMRYFKKSEDADDIVQEVFLKVFMNFKKFENRSSLKTWIYRIAINEIFTQFRKNKKHHNRELLDEILEDKGEAVKLKNRDMRSDFIASLKKLPKKRGQVMFYRVLEGLSFKEVGEVMNISEDSAKNLYSIGLKKIKKELQEAIS